MTLLSIFFFVNGLLLNPAVARDEVAKDCAQANINSVRYILGSGAPDFIEMSTEKEIVAKYGAHTMAPWALAMYPSAKSRMAGVLAQMMAIEGMRKYHDPGNTLPLPQYFEQVAQKPAKLSPRTISDLKEQFNLWRKGTYYDAQVRAFKAGAPYFCSYFSMLKCVGPVTTILDWMHPHDFGDWSVSMVDLWEKVFTDAEYIQGLAKAASIVSQRITGIRVDRNRRAALSDIFTDIVDGYRAVGKSDAEAKRRALDVLGVYGTRGASMRIAYQLPELEIVPLVAAITFLSSAMSYLDMIQPEGRYYSMPPSTVGTCMYGKPYHFWMGAYFVYALTGGRIFDVSAKDAAIAAHIVGRVYESNSSTFGRDPDQPFYEKILSLHNNQIRANLVINDAGTIWAAEGGKRLLNINAAIELLKSKAVALPPMAPNDLKKLLSKPVERDKAWIRMFAPDTLMGDWLTRTKIR